jgi:hypothetical protein
LVRSSQRGKCPRRSQSLQKKGIQIYSRMPFVSYSRMFNRKK